MIRLETFGSIGLRDADGREIESVLTNPKRFALLTFLASPPGTFHRRDTLLALFWPEFPNDRARASLRKAVHLLRQSLGAEALLRRGDDEIAVNPDLLWCDAAALDVALANAAFDEALELYRGDFLPGFFVSDAPEFEAWVDARRNAWRNQVARGALRLAEGSEAEGSGFAAAMWARRGFALLPQDEQVLRFLLTILDRVGDRVGAVDAYETFARQLFAEYGDEPDPETQELIGAIRGRRNADVVAPDLPRTALPAPPSAMPQAAETSNSLATIPAWRRATPRVAFAAGILIAAGLLGITTRSRIEEIDAKELQATGVVDVAALPEGYLDHRATLGDVVLGKYFEGQEIRLEGEKEVLTPTATRPLQLRGGDAGHNLYRGQSKVWGGNLSGVGPSGVRGTGPVAVEFVREQAQLGLEFARANGGRATLRFYNRNGDILGTITIDPLENREYAFVRRGAKADIAGFTLEGTDPREGLSLRRVRLTTDKPTFAVADPHRIAVIPLDPRNEFAATIAAQATELLSRRIDGLDELRSVDAESVLIAARRGAISASSGRSLALRLNAGWFVTGEASIQDGRARIHASLFATGSAAPIASADGEGSQSQLGTITDEIIRDLMGRTFQSGGRFPAARASREAPSLSWLRSYLAGEMAISRGDYASAVDLLGAAVKRTPSSVMAHYRLSQAAYRNSQFNVAKEHAAAALEMHRPGGNAADRERVRLEGWAALVNDSGLRAEQHFRSLLSAADDKDAWQGLAETMWRWAPAQGRPISEVKTVYEAAFRAEPDFGPLRYRLGLLSAAVGETERADFMVRTAFRTAPPWLQAHESSFRDALKGSTLLSAEQLRMLPYGRLEVAAGRVAVYAGRPEQALAMVMSGLAVRNPDQRARAFLMASFLEAARGRPSAAYGHLRELETFDAAAAAQTRRRFERQQFLNSTTRTVATDARASAVDMAIEEAVPGDPDRRAGRYLRALGLERLGQTREALALLESITEDDIRSAMFVAPAALARGRIHERRGEPRAALLNYKRFLMMWRDAEPALRPSVEDAEARVEELER